MKLRQFAILMIIFALAGATWGLVMHHAGDTVAGVSCADSACNTICDDILSIVAPLAQTAQVLLSPLSIAASVIGAALLIGLSLAWLIPVLHRPPRLYLMHCVQRF